MPARHLLRRGGRFEPGEHFLQCVLVGSNEGIGVWCRSQHVEELRCLSDSRRQVGTADDCGVSKERMHLDLETDDIEAEYSCARLVMKRSPAGQVRPAPNRHESQGLTTLRPHLAAVAGQWVEHTDAGVWIWARSQAPQATCPSCGHASTRAHGRYPTPAGGCVDWRAQGWYFGCGSAGSSAIMP